MLWARLLPRKLLCRSSLGKHSKSWDSFQKWVKETDQRKCLFLDYCVIYFPVGKGPTPESRTVITNTVASGQRLLTVTFLKSRWGHIAPTVLTKLHVLIIYTRSSSAVWRTALASDSIKPSQMLPLKRNGRDYLSHNSSQSITGHILVLTMSIS